MSAALAPLDEVPGLVGDEAGVQELDAQEGIGFGGCERETALVQIDLGFIASYFNAQSTGLLRPGQQAQDFDEGD